LKTSKGGEHGRRNFVVATAKRLVADKVMQKLGGRLRLSISGGAALPPNVSRLFIALGLPCYRATA